MLPLPRRPRKGALGKSLCALLLWGMGAAGCSLGEVTAAEGGDVLVVESHLEAGTDRQTVLLHRSLQGEEVRGEPGAEVRISASSGEQMRLVQRPLEQCAGTTRPELIDSLSVSASCYTTDLSTLHFVRPGVTYQLEVNTRDGERVRGRTTVPGEFEFRQPVMGDDVWACALPPRTNLPLVWTRSNGAWSYLATMEIMGLEEALAGTDIEAPDRLELTGIAISDSDTTLVVPADFGLFELADVSTDLLVYLQGGFPPGVAVRVRLSAIDRNYVNAIRGGAFNPSGQIRISSVAGDGIGVFGSFVAEEIYINVQNDSSLPDCLR